MLLDMRFYLVVYDDNIQAEIFVDIESVLNLFCACIFTNPKTGKCFRTYVSEWRIIISFLSK